MVPLDLVRRYGSSVPTFRNVLAMLNITTMEELEFTLDCNVHVSVISSNIVTYCVILRNIACFPAHSSNEKKRLSDWSLISPSTSSTWHTGLYCSPIGLKWRRQGKGPLLLSSRQLWLPSRLKCWKRTRGPKHASNSRRPGVLISESRSTLLNLLLVCLPTLPRLRLLRDRSVGLVVEASMENI